MKSFLIFSFSFLFSMNIWSQESEFLLPRSLDVTPRLSVDGMQYPVGVNGEVFKSLYLDYRVSEKYHIGLEYFYYKFGTHEGSDVSLLFKWYVKKNLYLYAGPELQYDINQITGEHELMRVNLNLGVGYEVNPNLLLELGYHPQISKSKVDVFGTTAKQNTFSLRASF